MRLRDVLSRLHRYVGLSLAGFLTLAGVSGSVIAFHEEIDAGLNPDFHFTASRGPALPPSTLAARIEAQLPGAHVVYLALGVAAGRSADVRVSGGKGFDQVFADPATGKVLGKRQWGACCLAPERIVPFLYRLHYTMALPSTFGVLLMGSVALLWSFDCLVALALTLPKARPFWRHWRQSWTIKHPAGFYRRNFDLHRAGGLWLWLLLLILATSGVALNLPEQVFRPVVSLFSPLSPSYGQMAQARSARPGEAPIGFDAALERALAHEPGRAVGIFHYHGLYGVGIASAGGDGKSGPGPAYVYLDDRDGRRVNTLSPRHGSIGDRVIALQYPLHSGRIFGLWGRIAVALAGLAVAMLSVTGVIIWWKKTAGRRKIGNNA